MKLLMKPHVLDILESKQSMQKVYVLRCALDLMLEL